MPETKGSLILSLAQFLGLLNVFIVGKILFDYPLPSTKYVALPLLVLIGAINWYRYEKKLELDQLIDRWGSEDRVKANRNGLLIIGYLILSATFPVLYGMATNGQL